MYSFTAALKWCFLLLDVRNISAKHFTAALNIPSLEKMKWQIHGTGTGKSDEDEFNEDYDVDTSMDVEASTNNSEAILDTFVVDFVMGDIIGKVLAFINQIHLCGEDTQKYLSALCISNGCLPLEIKLWVWTQWGSVVDCFRHVSELHKVCFLSNLTSAFNTQWS